MMFSPAMLGISAMGWKKTQPTDEKFRENCTEEHMVLILEHEGGGAAGLD